MTLHLQLYISRRSQKWQRTGDSDVDHHLVSDVSIGKINLDMLVWSKFRCACMQLARKEFLQLDGYITVMLRAVQLTSQWHSLHCDVVKASRADLSFAANFSVLYDLKQSPPPYGDVSMALDARWIVRRVENNTIANTSISSFLPRHCQLNFCSFGGAIMWRNVLSTRQQPTASIYLNT